MDSTAGAWTSVLTWWNGWAPAFLLSCAIEVPVYLVMFELFGLVGPSRDENAPVLGRGRAVLLALVVNVVTHPVFWPIALRIETTAPLVAAEIVVTLVEGLLVWAVVRCRLAVCLACALVANCASAVLGSALWAYITSSAS